MVRALASLIQNPDRLRRLLDTTRTFPPWITAEHATRAVADLYMRARTLTPIPRTERHDVTRAGLYSPGSINWLLWLLARRRG
jgi:hypothetical protein